MSESHTFYCVSLGMRVIYIGVFSEWSWLSILSPEFHLARGDSKNSWRLILIGSGNLCPARFTLRGPLSLREWPWKLSLSALRSNCPSRMTVPKQCFEIVVHIRWLFLLQFLFFFIVGSGDSPLEDDEVGYSHARYKGECFACVLMRDLLVPGELSFLSCRANYNKVTRQPTH